jgi:tetratricopeptide (TPR) repeat protein
VRWRLLLAGGGAAAAALAFGALTMRRADARPADAGAEVATLSRSIAFFEQRLAADPENFLAAGHLADRYLLRYQLAAGEGDVRRAEQVAHAALRVAPNRAGALARLSSIHLTQHQFAEALSAAEQGVAADSTDAAALAALYDAAMASGRYGRAMWAAGRLPAASPAREIRTAGWLAAQGEVQAAHAMLERTCQGFRDESLRPQMIAWCLTELAGLRNEARGPAAARTLLNEALRVQPGYRGAVEGLAALAHAEGDWKESARLYGSIASDAHPDIHLRLAEAHRELGDPGAAARHEQAFLRVASRSEAEPLHAHPLALFYAATPATRDAALAVALRDVRRRPVVESWDVLSWVRFQRGELGQALAASDSAAAWGAPSPTMQYHRARILRALGREGEAAPLLREALRRPDLLEPEARREVAASRRG